jgi:soluble lytic murein transglycosylase-like protein
MRSFCRVYRPPVQPVGVLPSGLANHPDRIALRALFVKWGRAYAVPPELAEAVAWQESGWQNDVVSPDNAQGIGQLLPETATFVNGLLGTALQVTVPEDNIRMEVRMLSALLDATGGQVCDSVASYYQGLGTLHHIGVLPESQVYVRDVLSLSPRFR